MIRRVKKAFIDNLPNLEWMDNKTRAAAVGKVSVFVVFTERRFTNAVYACCRNSVSSSVHHTREQCHRD